MMKILLKRSDETIDNQIERLWTKVQGLLIFSKGYFMERYPSNTKEKAEIKVDRKVNKVVTGGVKTQKPSYLKEALGAFFVNDLKDLKHFVIFDVLIPKTKDIVSDLIDETKNMILFGDSRSHSNGSRVRSGYGNGTYVSYSSLSKPSSPKSPTSNNLAFDEVIFEEKGDAEEVLSSLCELVDRYQKASVGDLYDLTGRPTSYTDYDYGWTNLSSASTKRVREGYFIDLPKAQPLN